MTAVSVRADVAGRLRVPVIAAPMFLVSGPELVIAACRAGILGSFPAPNCRTAETLDQWLTQISAAIGDAPYAVNIVTHRTNTRLAEDLEVIARHRPPVVITALGSPAPALETVHGSGGIVLADVTSIGLAAKAAATGVDGLVCVSAGAGGHTGHLSPFAFISAVREFFDGLVVVGGGIADGAGVAGAVVAGADLVYVGTRFLATEESVASDAYKAMVIDNGADDLIVSDAVTGAPASWLRPSLVANGIDLSTMTFEGQRTYDAGAADTARRWRDLWAAGQGLGRVRAVEPVAAVVDELAAEYDAALARIRALP